MQKKINNKKQKNPTNKFCEGEPMTMNEEEFKRFEALMKAALNTLPITNKEIIAKSKARTKAKREQRKS